MNSAPENDEKLLQVLETLESLGISWNHLLEMMHKYPTSKPSDVSPVESSLEAQRMGSRSSHAKKTASRNPPPLIPISRAVAGPWGDGELDEYDDVEDVGYNRRPAEGRLEEPDASGDEGTGEKASKSKDEDEEGSLGGTSSSDPAIPNSKVAHAKPAPPQPTLMPFSVLHHLQTKASVNKVGAEGDETWEQGPTEIKIAEPVRGDSTPSKMSDRQESKPVLSRVESLSSSFVDFELERLGDGQGGDIDLFVPSSLGGVGPIPINSQGASLDDFELNFSPPVSSNVGLDNLLGTSSGRGFSARDRGVSPEDLDIFMLNGPRSGRSSASSPDISILSPAKEPPEHLDPARSSSSQNNSAHRVLLPVDSKRSESGKVVALEKSSTMATLGGFSFPVALTTPDPSPGGGMDPKLFKSWQSAKSHGGSFSEFVVEDDVAGTAASDYQDYRDDDYRSKMSSRTPSVLEELARDAEGSGSMSNPRFHLNASKMREAASAEFGFGEALSLQSPSDLPLAAIQTKASLMARSGSGVPVEATAGLEGDKAMKVKGESKPWLKNKGGGDTNDISSSSPCPVAIGSSLSAHEIRISQDEFSGSLSPSPSPGMSEVIGGGGASEQGHDALSDAICEDEVNSASLGVAEPWPENEEDQWQDGREEEEFDDDDEASPLEEEEAHLDSIHESEHSTMPKYSVDENGAITYHYDRAYIASKYETFSLQVIHRRHRTGFEETKDFPIRMNDLIAGRYQVMDFLGSAAFSRAVQALDVKTNTLVCLKIVKNNKDYFDQSLDEIKLLKFVNSNDPSDEHGVVRLYDYFYYKEHLFLVCELLRANLYEFQKYNKESGEEHYFSNARIQKIATSVLKSIAYLHSLDLIHSDLKPENILIKSYSRCEVKVIDLGSSCFSTDQLSSYVQSRSYRAPEVILGLPYDHKIDIWSLGCILAELSSGLVLFQNDSVNTLLARMEGILGPIPMHMKEEGRYANRFFTRSGQIYERIQGPNGQDQAEILTPKRTSLRHRLPGADSGLLSFILYLLAIDPKARPTAREALLHPWLSQSLQS